MNIFSKKKCDDDNELLLEIPDLPQKTSYFGKHLSIKGRITGEDNLHLDGKIEGTIESNSDIKINKSAIINGDIKANNILNSGVIKGNIKADNKLSLDKTAKVNGKITTPSVSINEGAIFDGEMEMDASNIVK